MSRKSRRKAASKKVAPNPVPKANQNGRISCLTPELSAKLVECIKAGTPITFAGPKCGVSVSVVMKWMAKGRNGTDPICIELFYAIKAAQAEFVQGAIGEIRQQGAKNWQALAWLLERMFREEFASDKFELNQLKKELRELRLLISKVPRASEETASDHTPAQISAKPTTEQKDSNIEPPTV